MLIGSDLGIIYNYDVNKKVLIDKFDETGFNSKIVSLKNINNQFIFLKENTEIQFRNLYDTFDQKIYKIHNNDNWAVDMKIINNNSIVGLKDGEIYSKNNNNENNFIKINKIKCKYLNKIINIDNDKYLTLSKGSMASIYNLENNKLIWEAKNVKQDDLGIQKSINDLNGWYENNNLYICDKYSMIRFFDLRTDRRKSIWNKDFIKTEKSPINNIIVKNNQLIFNNFNGTIYISDLRNDFSLIKKFMDSTSSITDLKFKNNILYTIGLDRYFRSYDMDELILENEVFLNIKLRCLEDYTLDDIINKMNSDDEISLNEKEQLKGKDIKKSMNHNRVKLIYEKNLKDN